jgi:3-hydroxyisobutyrate dehydrogenase
METVGFIGLGNMGAPVARHIQKAGFPMVVYDLREGATRPFLDDGARLADSPAQVASLSDVIFSALPTPKDVEAAAIGPGGILEGIRRGGVYVDISTSRPSLIRRLEPLFRQKGADVLDAPVGGGQPGTAQGIHEVMVGGDPEVYQRVKPVLAAFGDQIIYAGSLGSGSICKLVHQMVGCGVSQAIAEGLTMGVKAGVDPEVLWESLRRGLVGRMHMLHEQIPQSVFRGQYEPALFTLALLHKDLGLATELGREHNVPMPMTTLVEQIYTQAMNRGWGRRTGYTAPFVLQEEAAGVEVRVPGVDLKKAAAYITTHPDDPSERGLKARPPAKAVPARRGVRRSRAPRSGGRP